MKAQLTFDIDDNDDAMAHLRCVKALDMAIALWEIQTNCKRTLEDKTEGMSSYETIEVVFDYINDLLQEHDINVNKLVI